MNEDSSFAVLFPAVSFLGLQFRLINVCSKQCDEQRQTISYGPPSHKFTIL